LSALVLQKALNEEFEVFGSSDTTAGGRIDFAKVIEVGELVKALPVSK
jgi:hypothetical protein